MTNFKIKCFKKDETIVINVEGTLLPKIYNRTFFVHPRFEVNEENEIVLSEKEYTVSEFSTGFRLLDTSNKETAFTEAKRFARQIGKELFLKRIKETEEKSGIINQ